MRFTTKTIFAATALAGASLVATAPASARTFVSVGIGGPAYPAYGYGYGYPGYYPAYYPGYYAPYYGSPVFVGGGYYGGRGYYGHPYRGGYYGRGHYHGGYHDGRHRH